MYNKEKNEHWSYDRKETVPGWYEIDNLHHIQTILKMDTYGDKDSSDKDDK